MRTPPRGGFDARTRVEFAGELCQAGNQATCFHPCFSITDAKLESVGWLGWLHAARVVLRSSARAAFFISTLRILRQDVMNHLAMHISETAIGAVVAEGKFFVIDAEQVQHRGMEIVIGGGLLRGFP
jgi:hypothetical protein